MGSAAAGEDEGTAAPPRPLLLMAEVALAATTLAGVVGLTRLFDGLSFLVPVLAFALAAHGLAAGCRRARLSPAATAGAAVGGLVLGISVFLLPETTLFGIPTGRTLTQAGEELSAALATFREAVAPAPVEPGFVLAAVVVVWLLAFVADTAAFRARATVEATIPALTLFLFGAALGAPPHRVATTGLFLAALVAYWLAQRLLGHWRVPTRMTSHADGGSGSLLRTGAAMGVAAVTAAMLVGPLLPGAEATAVIPWRAGEREDASSRVTISPLVDIRSRMVDQADVELFTVESHERSYWRLTSLSIFDGRIWSSRGQYREVEGRLSAAAGADRAETSTVLQEFEIAQLASIWLPAAYEPVGIEGVEARYDADSASLLTEEESASGLRYRVLSEVGAVTGAELDSVPNVAPVDVAETYTALPDDFSSDVGREAARVVEGAGTQYEKARLLQDHLRSFTYDLSVPPGHGGDDIERFLFETRRGYCEQFAGAFAAMARSVGLPARVAVGFTPGEQTAGGRFQVRGYNAHAWPEVFLAGYGWVAFEPTPGRGIPGAEEYTGVPEQQAGPQGGSTATTRPSTATTVDTGQGAATTAPAPDQQEDPGAAGGAGEDGFPWPVRLSLAALAVAAIPVLWAGGLAAATRRRRARRRAAATTPTQRVLVAWTEVGEALSRVGAPPRAWETPTEYAQRAAGATAADHRLLNALAGVTTAAGYGPGEIDDRVAESAARAAADLERELEQGLDTRARLLHALDPRPLLPERPPRMDVRVGA